MGTPTYVFWVLSLGCFLGAAPQLLTGQPFPELSSTRTHAAEDQEHGWAHWGLSTHPITWSSVRPITHPLHLRCLQCFQGQEGRRPCCMEHLGTQAA